MGSSSRDLYGLANLATVEICAVFCREVLQRLVDFPLLGPLGLKNENLDIVPVWCQPLRSRRCQVSRGAAEVPKEFLERRLDVP